jgi:N-acetylmuramoyl-L-alanine amidase
MKKPIDKITALFTCFAMLAIPSIAHSLSFNLNAVLDFVENINNSLRAQIQIDKEVLASIYDEITDRKPIKNDEVIKKYKKGDTKILIVPGHDLEYKGAEFKNLTEQEINLELGEHLLDFLNDDKNIEAHITRNSKGYTKEFEQYFKKEREAIEEFMSYYKAATGKLIATENFEPNQQIYHNDAPSDMAIRLYGINRWANENEIDLIIHIHFNDYAGRPWKYPGEYHGFSIYIPEAQMKNSQASRSVAEKIAYMLDDYFAKSNMPGEKDNIIETQELIAIGSNHTLIPASILMEYDYLYEPKLHNRKIRSLLTKEYAYRTYLGVKNFLNKDRNKSQKDDSFLLGEIQSDLWNYMDRNEEVVRLQAFLHKKGYYPGPRKTFSACPITGYFGDCTTDAVKKFQKQNNLTPTGFVGEETREIINSALNLD